MGGRDLRTLIRRGGEKGASLVELLVAVSVFAIVMLAIYMTYDVSQAGYVRGTTDIDLQDNGRKAQEAMATLVRAAGYDPTGADIFGFNSAAGFTPMATDSTLVFSVDADQDGVLDNIRNERVGFALFGTDLRRTMDGVTPDAVLPPVARNVQGLQFSYFDVSDVPIPNPAVAPYTLTAAQMATIRRINIRLTLSDTAGVVGQRVYTLSTDLRLRNM